MKSTPTAIWNKDYILAYISNMLIFFSLYLLVPILPFYLMQDLGLDESQTGLVIGLLTISSLIARPFSGFLVDLFSRKPLYMICFAIYTLAIGGYALASTISLIVILRIMHGIGFGLSTVSSSTLAIDVIPAERRGEGIGYFGIGFSIAQSIGPLAGFWLYNNFSFDYIFAIAFGVAAIGFLTIIPIKLPTTINITSAQKEQEKISLDRFILIKGLPCVLLFLLVSYAYGTTSNYIGLYCQQSEFSGANPTLFYLIFALFVILARIVSAKMIDNGGIIKVIIGGSISVACGYLMLAYCYDMATFIAAATLIGIGFGAVNPAFQALLVNLSSAERRGSANSTYYIFLDMGVIFGVVFGGFLMEYFSFKTLLLVCCTVTVIGIIHFLLFSKKHYYKAINQ